MSSKPTSSFTLTLTLALGFLIASSLASLACLGLCAPALADRMQQRIVWLDSGAPDLSIQSIFSKVAQGRLVTEVRDYLKKRTGFDPLRHEFKTPITLNASIHPEMKPAVKALVEGLTGFHFDEDELTIEIEGLNYQTPQAKLEISEISQSGSSIDVPVRIRFQETTVSAKKLWIRFHSTRRAFFNTFWIKLENPTIYSKSMDSLDMNFRVHAEVSREIVLTLPESNFKVFEDVSLEALTKSIEFNPGSVETSQLAIHLGKKKLDLNPEGLKAALRLRKAAIARLIMTPLVDSIKTLPAKVIKPKLWSLGDQVILPSHFKFPIGCTNGQKEPLEAHVHSIGQLGRDQLFIGLKIDGVPQASRKGLDASLEETYRKIDSDEASVALSISESAFSSMGKRIFECVLADKLKATTNGKVEVAAFDADFESYPWGKIRAWVKIHGGVLQGLVLGKRTLTFPVTAEPKISFTKTGLSLDISSVDVTQKTLLGTQGSNLNEIRFKKIVLKQIPKQVQNFQKKSPYQVEITESKDLDLSSLKIQSDGYGRLSFLIPLDPELDPKAVGYWEFLKQEISRLH